MNEFQRGWAPLLAATTGTMCGIMTVTNYTQGFFAGPVIAEFGWAPPQFFLGFTVMMLTGLVTAPLAGTLVHKFGLKRLGMIGLIGHAIGYILLSLNPGSLPLWLASWAVLAVLAAGSLPIIWTGVLNGWFVRNRGKAIGITMCGTGLGAFLYPPIIQFLIDDYGWRTAYQFIGIGALVVSLPIVYFLFKENTQGADAEGATPVSADWGMTRGEAIKSPRFWVLGALLGLTVFVVVALMSNLPRFLPALGAEPSTVANIAAIMGITIVIGRLAVGALVDRFFAPYVGMVCFALPLIGLLLLLNLPFSVPVAVSFALFLGLAAGAELDLLAYLTSKYFGPKDYPKVFGGIFAFFTVGAGIAPPVMSQMAANMGGYETPLMIMCVLLVVCIGLFYLLGDYPEEAKAESGH